ncbi:MAG TPA: hypothetical protein GXX14_12165 [Clostridiaceae bacterium]|nr:hypothetical protein [Clostridiaceae bacterium]
MVHDDKYLTFMGKGPRKVAHIEHWSCPDAETYLTGIDYYENPRLCRIKMAELYPQLGLPIPGSNDPKPRPKEEELERKSMESGEARRRTRWGDGESADWDWGKKFKTPEEVFAFSPLQQMDFTKMPVVESRDYSDEEGLYKQYRKLYPAEWGDKAPEGQLSIAWFYNTMFMWPLLTFGWELFLETCLDERFERIMDEIAELSRRVFRVFSRLPVNVVLCHDDIVTSRGPVCSPEWMHKYIFPRYEEFWSMLKKAGKKVVMVVDGCIDAYVDDIMACGADGFITEPYTDFKRIAARYKDCILAGEGDNRILMNNNPDEIKDMVLRMADTAKMSGGYFMCIGNHIPWNVPPEAVKRYLDYSDRYAYRW